MPWYTGLTHDTVDDRRTAEGLLRLKAALDLQVPPRTIDQTLLLATWNIREFDSEKYGLRSDEPLHYMAEIINRFDVVAVQEVRDNLQAFNRLVRYLGSRWRFLFTDVTEGRAGNRERVAFLYDGSKVSFSGLAGEVQLPPRLVGTASRPRVQLARSPYIVGLTAGWLKFALCTTHILYGDDVADEPRRIREIRDLVQFLIERSASEYPDARNSILLGDFNVFDTTDKTLQAITSQGYTVPTDILAEKTNVNRNKHFDQIAIQGSDISPDQILGLKGGAFHFFEHVYRDDAQSTYASTMGAAYRKTKDGTLRDEAGRRRYYRDWRTYQMSDHVPLWLEIPIDFSADHLQALATAPERKPTRKTVKKTARRRGISLEADTSMLVASPPPPPSAS